jgi:hypothetical protein
MCSVVEAITLIYNKSRRRAVRSNAERLHRDGDLSYGEWNPESSVKTRLQHDVAVEVLEGVHTLKTEPGRASVQVSLFAIPEAESHDKGLGAYRAKGLVTSDSKSWTSWTSWKSSTCAMLS